eukprot:11470991-Ditylum_brightwellii.AAC.1
MVETPQDTYNMSTLELDKMLKMCGLKSGEYDMLPEWLKHVNAKGQTEDTQNVIITELLQQHRIYDD